MIFPFKIKKIKYLYIYNLTCKNKLNSSKREFDKKVLIRKKILNIIK